MFSYTPHTAHKQLHVNGFTQSQRNGAFNNTFPLSRNKAMYIVCTG